MLIQILWLLCWPLLILASWITVNAVIKKTEARQQEG